MGDEQQRSYRWKNVWNDGVVFIGGKQFLVHPQSYKWNSKILHD